MAQRPLTWLTRFALAAMAGFGLLAGLTTQVRAGDDTCSEPNDSRESACALASGASIAGFLNSADDVDVYRIEVSQGLTVQAGLSTLPGDYGLRLEAADGNQVAEAVGSGAADRSLEAAGLAGGAYFLVVASNTGESSADQSYTLTFYLQIAAAEPAAAPAPQPEATTVPGPERPLTDLVLNAEEAGEKAKAAGTKKGSDARSSWYQITYKRDSAPQVSRLGPRIIVNRVYRATDIDTARQIFIEQTGAGLPEAKEQGLGFNSLGGQPMDPIGGESQAVGACGDCSSDPAVRHYRIVFRIGNLVETIYTYGPDTGNYFGVAAGLARAVEKRIYTAPAGPLPEIFSNRLPEQIGLTLPDAGRQAFEKFSGTGADGRSRWYEARFERGEEDFGAKLGPSIMYNKVFVANSQDDARAIFSENAIRDLPEATEVRGPIFIEDKTKSFGNQSFAIGACNNECGDANTDRLHERLVFRWGNVVVVLYIWGRDDVSNPDAISTFAASIAGRIP